MDSWIASDDGDRPPIKAEALDIPAWPHATREKAMEALDAFGRKLGYRVKWTDV